MPAVGRDDCQFFVFQYTFALQGCKLSKKMALFHLLQALLRCEEKIIFTFLKNVITNVYVTLQTGLHKRMFHFPPFSQERKKLKLKKKLNKAFKSHLFNFSEKYHYFWENKLFCFLVFKIKSYIRPCFNVHWSLFIQIILTPKPLELEGWNFEGKFTLHRMSHVMCYWSPVIFHLSHFTCNL